jgi:hypothetical protein
MLNDVYILNKEPEDIVAYHVEVEDVKIQLNLGTSETSLEPKISEKIPAAYADAKAHTGNHFAKTVVKYSGYNFNAESIVFGYSPLLYNPTISTSVDNVAWIELEFGVDFLVQKRTNDFGIIFATVIEAPYIKFEFTVGYEVGELPENAKAAIVLKAGDMVDTESSSYSPTKIQVLKTYELLLADFMKFRVK